MTIQKQEVLQKLTSVERGYLKVLESYLDEKLSAEYTGYHVIVSLRDLQTAVGAEKPLHTRVVQTIIAMYSEAGWEVAKRSDQLEDDSWLEFS